MNGAWPRKKEDLLKKYRINEETFDRIINESKKILFNERNNRVKPGLDDKILTSWNALMLRGYVDAYFAFNEEKFLSAALNNGEFILKNMMSEDGRLKKVQPARWTTLEGGSMLSLMIMLIPSKHSFLFMKLLLTKNGLMLRRNLLIILFFTSAILNLRCTFTLLILMNH